MIPEKNKDRVVIILSREEAERISWGLSDILCWCRGFMAGRGDDTSNSPFGVEEARTINIKIKEALNDK